MKRRASEEKEDDDDVLVQTNDQCARQYLHAFTVREDVSAVSTSNDGSETIRETPCPLKCQKINNIYYGALKS